MEPAVLSQYFRKVKPAALNQYFRIVESKAWNLWTSSHLLSVKDCHHVQLRECLFSGFVLFVGLISINRELVGQAAAHVLTKYREHTCFPCTSMFPSQAAAHMLTRSWEHTCFPCASTFLSHPALRWLKSAHHEHTVAEISVVTILFSRFPWTVFSPPTCWVTSGLRNSFVDLCKGVQHIFSCCVIVWTFNVNS